jgi:hypothetical protein
MGMKRDRAGTASRGGADPRRILIATVAVVLIALCAPVDAFATGPAVDEYSLDLPDAKGKVENPARPPVGNSADLPANVVAQLKKSPDGNALATIATAGQLGAPSPLGPGSHPSGVAGSQPSTLSAVGSAVGDPAIIGLILLLALVGGGLFLARARRGTGA